MSAKSVAAPIPPQSAHCVRSQLPQGDALGSTGNFAATTEAVPLGKVASPQAMTEGVLPGKHTLHLSRKLHHYAKGSPFEERLPPLRGKMSHSDKRGNLASPVGLD